MRIPFGRLMLFFLITACLFGLFSLFRWFNPFFVLYTDVARYSLMGSAICFVLWLIATLFRPGSLFEPGRSAKDVEWLAEIFCELPYFRISLLSLVVSIALAWLHSLVFPTGITVFLVAFDMFLARLLFFTYGSANRL